MRSYFFVIVTVVTIVSGKVYSAKWAPPRENAPSIKTGITGGSLMLDVTDPKGEVNPPIKYRPNTLGKVAVGISYLGFGATVGVVSKADPVMEMRKGKSTGVDYQFRFFREQNSFDLFYQRVQGFYIENSKAIDSSIVGDDPYLQNPDLHSEHLGFQYFRTLSPDDFSMAAVFDQNGWQKESGGTWFIYGALDRHHLDTDTSLIPASLTPQFSSIVDFRTGDFTTAKLGFGGGYAYVFNEFYLALKVIAAYGQQLQEYSIGSTKVKRQVSTTGGNVKVSLGYNGDQYFSSLNLFNDSTSLSVQDRAFGMATLEVSFFMGMHL